MPDTLQLSVHYLILSSYHEVSISHILHMTKLRLSNLFKVIQFPNASAGVACLSSTLFPCTPRNLDDGDVQTNHPASPEINNGVTLVCSQMIT